MVHVLVTYFRDTCGLTIPVTCNIILLTVKSLAKLIALMQIYCLHILSGNKNYGGDQYSVVRDYQIKP